ncbi:MAG: PSD1 and planctomycete cytochrome C domain-containing protein [Bryobacteraceae bacterium]
MKLNPALTTAACWSALALAQTLPPAATERVDFSRQIEPLFRQRCQMCHGAQQQMSSLRLDNHDDALKGGNSGAVINPGDSQHSRLIRLVAGLEGKVVMPPAGKRLSPQEVGLLRAWIDQGATWPAGGVAVTASAKPRHWSFQPIARPKPPATQNETWPRNPIDQFILARLEQEGIEPSAEADKRTLIRRVSLDLTGLLPSPEEVEAFLRDNRPDAYERLVNRLLDSRHFGEKWARQWLDLARYADSDGYEKDYIRPHAWRYRQWVIEALNRDMPFDEFTIEQIAGDLMPGSSVDQKVATGFHRNTLTNREGGVKIEQFRVEQVVDRAATVGTVWLGLTFGCAQCHDHKYDPLKQKEFYQFYAFFNNADEIDIDAPLAGEMGPYLAAVTDYRRKRDELLAKYHVAELMPPWEARMKEARANPGKWTDWDHTYDAFQKYLDNADKILDTPLDKRTLKQTDAITDHFVINYHRVITKERWKELDYVSLRKQLTALRAAFPALSEAPVIEELSANRRKAHVHLRGDYRKLGVEVQPGVPAFLPPMANDADPSRLTLARWLVDPGNPLTARVTVNRIWHEYFGHGIVRTSDDFGAQGEKPSHPELLDWLASGLIDHRWKLKAVHRLIVTSAAYRQSSKARPAIDQRDPNNILLARQQRLRLPAELIRDSALAASALLDPTVGGRSVRPPLPAGVTKLSYSDSGKWDESKGRDRYRRGLYIQFLRTIPYPQLINFDAPDANLAACRRERSNTPLQALNLLNDPVFTEAAQALAVRVLRDTPGSDLPGRAQRMFELCLVRPPSPREREWLLEHYRRQVQIFEKDAKSAEQYVPIEMQGHSRVELAAWTSLGSALLNLDEFITRE